MPNDSELNCNYSLYRREPTTKPTNRFLCFHTTAVVIALPACLKIISLQGGEGLLLLPILGICLYLVWVCLTFGCTIEPCLDIICSGSKECRAHNCSCKIKGSWRPRDRLIKSTRGGVMSGGWGRETGLSAVFTK